MPLFTQLLFAMRSQKPLGPFILRAAQGAEDLALVGSENLFAITSGALAQPLRLGRYEFMRFYQEAVKVLGDVLPYRSPPLNMEMKRH
jgi:hypothetical protein